MESKVSKTQFDNYSYDLLSEEIWKDNYREESEETREDTWERLAHYGSVIEKEDVREKVKGEFLQAFYNDKLVPGGRIIANLGIQRKGTTLFNCYVSHPSDFNLQDCDSIEGIYDMLKRQALTLKSEGGYGFNASWIRPEGSYVKGIQSRTPGVLKFAELWDKSSEIITLGSTKVLGERRKNEKNKIRKGAQMLVLNVWHPDVLDFIVAKQTEGRLTKFNVSVGITNGFMEALIADEDWNLEYPDTEHEAYKTSWYGDLEDWKEKGLPTIVYETHKASFIWNKIMECTYNRAEPGVLFLDLYNKLNPLYYGEKVHATNPCGEIGMATGVCNLASINVAILASFNDKTKQFEFDYPEFIRLVRTGVRFLDNINDISTTPLTEYDIAVQKKRRIGLGIMGLGSLHMMLGLDYGSAESKKFVETLYRVKTETELMTSAQLGKEKGSFEQFDHEQYFSSYWWQNLQISNAVKEKIEMQGAMRNSHHSMNAPTGNTGIYARNVSGGIEPVFSTDGYYRWAIVPEPRQKLLQEAGFQYPASTHQLTETEHMKFAQRGDEQILKGTFDGKEYEFDKSRGLTVRSFVEDYSVRRIKECLGEEAFEKLKNEGKLKSAQEISVQEHLDVLEIAAHYTNMSISKTVNIPADYNYEDFKDVYLKAWKANIKGITTYREGTMLAVLETKDSKAKQEQGNTRDSKTLNESHAPKRPVELECDIYHMSVKGEKWNAFVGLYGGKPYEIFAGRSEYVSIPRSRKQGTIKKNGKYNLIIGEGDNQIVIKDLDHVFESSLESAFTRTISLALRHGTPVQYVVEQLNKGADKENDMFSLSKGLMRVLKNYIKDGTESTSKKCKGCGESGTLRYQEGCEVCTACGHSKCG